MDAPNIHVQSQGVTVSNPAEPQSVDSYPDFNGADAESVSGDGDAEMLMSLRRRIAHLSDRVRNADQCIEAILDSVREGVLIVSDDGSIVVANPQAEFLLGRSCQELTGGMFGTLGTGESTTEINVVAADGLVHLVELRNRRIVWRGEPALLFTLQDITSHRSRAVQAEAEVTKRDNFIAMLSHELRNPLAAIANSSQWMLMCRRDPEDELALGVIGRQLNHLMRMLDDLLDVSRIARGKLEIRTEPIDLCRGIHDAISAAFEDSDLNDRVLNVDLPGSPVFILADPVRLQQVICNLLTNAARYSSSGDEINLVVDVEDRVSECDSNRRSNVANPCNPLVTLCVRDTGMGIPKDMLDTIFLPFVQTDQAIDRSAGGMGLGLALARQIVELHGGTITADSQGLGSGSEFCVTFDAIEAPEAKVAMPHSAEPAVGLRVLLIEDSVDIRTTLRMLLQADRHEVLERDDGPSGLAALIEHRPDVAIIDIGLPGLTGYQIAEAAAMFEGRDGMRLIAATGYGRPEDRHAAIQAGFDEHVTKPINYQTLRRLLGTPSDTPDTPSDPA